MRNGYAEVQFSSQLQKTLPVAWHYACSSTPWWKIAYNLKARRSTSTVSCVHTSGTSLINADTIWTKLIVLISEVSLFQEENDNNVLV